MRAERRRAITDPTNSCAIQGVRCKNLLSSPLLEKAKSICRNKSYLRYSLVEVLDELADDDYIIHPEIDRPRTQTEIANVANIFAFFGISTDKHAF